VVVDDGSSDVSSIAAICRSHGAACVRRRRAGGPAAARNAALPMVTTELIAFLDSDCVADEEWLQTLSAHFADPLVGAVAARIRPLAHARNTVLDRFAYARTPLDMGPAESLVVPHGRVRYVPTAALMVRRDAIGRGFDERLRYGEDVDLVWRLHDAGWRIRYEPRAVIRHEEPHTWRALFGRRMRYGTSAAALSRRHPMRLAHFVLAPLPAATVALLLLRRTRAAHLLAGAHVIAIARRLRTVGVPLRESVPLGVGTLGHTLVALGRGGTMFAAPALLSGLRTRRGRRACAALLLAQPMVEFMRQRPRLDPVTWTVACIADDVAYGLGVWRGCVRERTVAPLIPRRARREPERDGSRRVAHLGARSAAVADTKPPCG
jgi:mycofactocin glycosyltransferase